MASSAGPAPPGRGTLLGRARRILDDEGALVLTGPWGSGRTTLLAAMAEPSTGRPPVRVALAESDRDVPFGVISQLLAALPEAALRTLRGPRRRVVAELLRHSDPPPEGWDPVAVRLALADALLPVPALLVIDDVQWLDGASADVLRHTPSRSLRVLAAERGTAPGSSPLRGARLAVPPLDVADVAGLLHDRGLPERWAGRVHRHCGGHAALVNAMVEGIAPGSRPAQPPPIPPEVGRLAAAWLGTVPDAAAPALLAAALSHRPDLETLRRAGHDGTGLDAARRAGVIELDDPVVFAAEALRRAVIARARPGDRLRTHAAMAEAVMDPVHAVRHRVLAVTGFDEATARRAEEAAAEARSCGERALSSELMLLAGARTPNGLRAERLRRLVGAAADAAGSARADLAKEVAEAMRAARGGPAEQVAALLAVVDASGQALKDVDEELARAADLAARDPALLAAVRLREAVRANLCEGSPHRTREIAAQAVELARAAADPAIEVRALTMRARMERVCSDPAAAATLAEALDLDVPPDRIGVADGPRYLAARHAVFDDRLDEARDLLLDLLPLAERRGGTEDLEEVLRSLAEVDVRSGHCARALAWSERALAVCSAAGLSPGPVWYTGALVQTAGGTFQQAAEYAHRGALVSREEHDLVFRSRNLLALGTVRLITGRPGQAVATLLEVAELEGRQQVVDLRALRWHPELVEALAAAGRLDEAEHLLDRTHATAVAQGVTSTGVGPSLLRARAAVQARHGEIDEARDLLTRSADAFAALGLPLEEGRTHVSRGRLERSNRRPAAARAAWTRAAALFDQAGARPWRALTADLLDRLEPRGTGTLTEAERRLAALVAQGATNQEAAGRLFLSVKTVEAMLSRIYRKLGIRSRTQLVSTLDP
ncbi:LuxR C-terminal-related transcriptional regulator [Spirillospora sp. CA-294931]|uniref:LuxR C-terminal-related transcriptional regulator n=1 Tax=Spirillospora sp. CA-294931 TaxID=3240042 RepID=UPI003D92B160